MRALREAVERSWSEAPGTGARALSVVTTPLSWAWRSATAMRNGFRDRRPATAIDGVRVVSVGNLAVGGTGKTPVTAWVVDRLRARGEQPAVVLSGYGADEVLLHRRWHPEIPVFSDPRRIAAIERARAAGAQVVVLDDGFQHRAAARDLDVVLLAAEHRFPGHVLPRGPYREPASALRRADVVLVTRRTASLEEARRVAANVGRVAPGAVAGSLALVPGAWLDVHGRKAAEPAGPILALSAVARPATFVGALRELLGEGTDIRPRGFPDHHEYTEQDIGRIRAEAEAEGRILVSTEKDAVKLARLKTTPDSMRVLSSRIEWDWGEEALDAMLVRDRGAPA